ncbi:hypothetical protein D9758_001003 [Tetrapyrgos nigripes]|uniref:Uncharacterized protein n=1 Tax=Tetrapyrgos nigripes TaxID=182062 RepID=A0A8H5GZZ5_9AGAR|nr:hypothetical protein D9758_001003 [Tetrapyrgos nigripes]
MRPDSPIPEKLQTKEKKRKSITTARANGEDPIESVIPSKKAKTADTGNVAKAVATTAVKAATKRLKNTLSKPNTKSKNTQDSDIESNVPRASTTISKKSSSSKPLVTDVDEDSDEPQPAPPKKCSIVISAWTSKPQKMF